MLKAFGFSGIVVLVDRVDEPHLINGSLEKMKGSVWSMLDNKFLKQPGLGLKLLLPIELAGFVEQEDRDFYQRARLDKQNMIPSLEWTGAVALRPGQRPRGRLRAPGGHRPSCAICSTNRSPTPGLIEAFASCGFRVICSSSSTGRWWPTARASSAATRLEDQSRDVRVAASTLPP